MEREIKIAELARLWNVSVNTTWTRIKKEGLITLKKLDNNREIAFVTIPDDIFNKYMVNNGVNNPNYEELLSDDNPSLPPNNISNADILDKMIDFSNEVQDRLITLNNHHNEEIMNLNEELNKYKNQFPLLEDRASREGVYLQEIKDLKKVNNIKTKWLITLIITSLLIIISMSFMLMYQHFNPKTVEKEKQVTKIITVDRYGKPVSVLTEKQ